MLNHTEDLNLLRRFARSVRGRLIRATQPKPPANRHVHEKIGNVIKEHKTRLYKQLKAGENLALACDKFITDVTRDLRAIVAREERR
jgi:hypothetical protein